MSKMTTDKDNAVADVSKDLVCNEFEDVLLNANMMSSIIRSASVLGRIS